ncbi:MAG: hypothetical protein ABI373_00285 [Flavobacteriales bacterium]
MYLLSASGTFDTILLLLIAWQGLRLIMRLNRKPSSTVAQGQRWTTDPLRPKGDVRIERLEEVKHSMPPVDAEDAQFEVIKEDRSKDATNE